jgi:integrase
MAEKNREWPVVMWFNYNGKNMTTTIGVKTTEQNWDKKKQRLKPGHSEANRVNREIDLLEEKANKIYSESLASGVPLDSRCFIERLKAPELKPIEKKPASFFDEWEKYMKVKEVRCRFGTLKSAKTAFNHFKEFCTKKGLTKITFDEFTDGVKAQFAEFLFDKEDGDNTVHAVQKRMNTFLNYAAKIGLHNNHSHKAFSIPERVGSIKFLQWDEVKKLIDVEVEPGLESDCRDLFVFCCLTAMRYSDVKNLKKLDIQEHKFKDLGGVHYAAHIRQQKTNNAIVVPLLPDALAILKKYKDEKIDFALPQRANQTVNRVIKQIGRRAKLNAQQELVKYRRNKCESSYTEKWRILSTHMGRRTFATMAITRGIPINVVASITGQNPKTTLKHYMGVIDSKKFEELANKMKF